MIEDWGGSESCIEGVKSLLSFRGPCKSEVVGGKLSGGLATREKP